jgi:hypothetical protein
MLKYRRVYFNGTLCATTENRKKHFIGINLVTGTHLATRRNKYYTTVLKKVSDVSISISNTKTSNHGSPGPNYDIVGNDIS